MKEVVTKKSVEVAMGPVLEHNFMIVPSFYVAQTDLSGPYNSLSPHNKRTIVKIWLVVFCCATTSATDIKVMEDYSCTSSLDFLVNSDSQSCYYAIVVVK